MTALDWQTREEVRGQARDIVAAGMGDVLAWLGTAIEPGPQAPLSAFKAYVASGARCPHPRAHQVRGMCSVCGLCYHRHVQLEDGGQSGWCLECGEDRHICDWR